MGVETMSALDELITRAGASDRDREAWLRERNGGVTATQIRDLYMGKLKRQDLIAAKLAGRIDPELTAPVIRWGNEREAVIAAVAEGLYGMVPESRVFRSAEDPRWLASPDGIRMNFDGEIEVAEIKTSGKDMTFGSVDFMASGYLAQMVWSMLVTGASRCLYGFEPRIDDGNGWYVPGELVWEWVSLDDYLELAGELVKEANAFLAEMDRQRTDGGPVLDEEVDTLAVNYLRGLAAEKEGAELKSSSYRQLMERVETDAEFVQESSLARVSFSPAKEAERDVITVDREAARAANPDLYSRLEMAADDVVQAKVALQVVQDAVSLHEQGFAVKTGVELVETKKKALRITAAKTTKGAPDRGTQE
jgi:hypothetical protein